jgi:predicted ATPase
VLLLFEDLHWIDAETQALLDALVESLPTARMLLLVNYRPEYQHAWGGKTYCLQLRIDPLAPESSDTLLTALLGEDATLSLLKRVLIARTEGNPFFLEESVRTLVETEVLVGKPGAYRVTTAPDAWQIPPTAQAILAARIDRLPPDAKRLLQAASVIGKDVPFVLLKAIADVPEDALRHELAILQASGFLYEAGVFPDLEYTFTHALTHDVAYGSLLQARRRTLHAAIVGAIEGAYADRLAEQTERLAHHALRGEIFDKAAQYLHAAGTRSVTRSVYRDGVAYFEQALSALGHLPRSASVVGQEIDLRLALHHALLPLGELQRSADQVVAADMLADVLGDPCRIGWSSTYRARAAWWGGDNQRAVASGERARLKTKDVGHLPLELSVNLILGQIYHSVGDYDRAVTSLEANLKHLVGDLAYERFDLPALPSVISREYLVLSLAEQGRFTEALAHGAEALRIATAVDHPYSRVVADLGIGGVLLRRGHLPEAARALERALALCQATSLGVAMPIVISYLGLALTQLGRVSEGTAYLEQAIEQAAAIGRLDQHALRLAYLGGAYLDAGRRDEAAAAATSSATFAREHGARGEEAWATRQLAEAAAGADPPEVDTAASRYGQSLALARELAMRPLVAHCHLGLGGLYRRTGDYAKASEHLSTEKAMYREMDMRVWLEKADEEPRASG